MEAKPDDVEAADVPAEEAAEPVVDINSFDDVKEFFNDGLDKLRASSAEDLKKTGLRAVNRIARAWRQLVDGD